MLNNSLIAIIGFIPNRLYYRFKVNNMIDILTTSNIPTEAFNKLRLIK